MKTLKEQTKTKARKKHKCSFCGGLIFKGDTYLHSVHVFDDHIYSWKSHMYCSKLAEELDMYDSCDCNGLTSEEFQYNINQVYLEVITKKIDPETKYYGDIIRGLNNSTMKTKISFLLRKHID